MQFHHHCVKREGLLGDICPFLNLTENLHTSLKSCSSLGILDASVVKIVMSTGERASWGFTSTAEQRDVFSRSASIPFCPKDYINCYTYLHHVLFVLSFWCHLILLIGQQQCHAQFIHYPHEYHPCEYHL